MKQLKIILLLLAISFGSSVPAMTTIPQKCYFNTIKGGLQVSQKLESEKIAVLKVEGTYEYYLQYLRYKLDYKKNQDKEDTKNLLLSPPCVLADTLAVSC